MYFWGTAESSISSPTLIIGGCPTNEVPRRAPPEATWVSLFFGPPGSIERPKCAPWPDEPNQQAESR